MEKKSFKGVKKIESGQDSNLHLFGLPARLTLKLLQFTLTSDGQALRL
jgi:hypothetical protein